ncbi:TPA: hypothetical protein ACIKIH_001584, partial [Streptococcus pneumoniae]
KRFIFLWQDDQKNKQVLCNLHKTLENIGEFEEDNLYYSSIDKSRNKDQFSHIFADSPLHLTGF